MVLCYYLFILFIRTDIMFKKFLSLALALVSTIAVFALCGCENNENTNTTTTTSVQQNPLYADIIDAIERVAQADKTNALEDELKKYPEYFINSDMGYGGMENFKQCIKENFYSCDTDYMVYKIEDVTSTYEKEIEKELKEDFEADIDIQQVAKVEDAYKFYNYDDNEHIDDSTFVPSTEYFIKFNNTWYYGWGLTLNSEVEEIEQ